MYSIEQTVHDPFGGTKTIVPQGQFVSVLPLRNFGAKVTNAELATSEPLNGYIRKVHDDGKSMAYRYRGYLTLETNGYQPREIARLFSPVLQDWNQDGQIWEGWILERSGTKKLHQVVQLWWVRPLKLTSVLDAKPELKGAPAQAGDTTGT